MIDTPRIVVLSLPVLLTCIPTLGFELDVRGATRGNGGLSNLVTFLTAKEQYFAEVKALALAHLASYEKEQELKDRLQALKRRCDQLLEEMLQARMRSQNPGQIEDENAERAREPAALEETPRKPAAALIDDLLETWEGMKQLRRDETARVKRLAELDHRKYRSGEDLTAFMEHVEGLQDLELEENYEEDFAKEDARLKTIYELLGETPSVGGKSHAPRKQHTEL